MACRSGAWLKSIASAWASSPNADLRHLPASIVPLIGGADARVRRVAKRPAPRASDLQGRSRMRPNLFPTVVSLLAVLLVAPISHGKTAQPPQSAHDSPPRVLTDLADTTTRIAQLAERSDYDAAIALADQLAETMKARLGVHHADYARIVYHLADLANAARRPADAIRHYNEAI